MRWSWPSSSSWSSSTLMTTRPSSPGRARWRSRCCEAVPRPRHAGGGRGRRRPDRRHRGRGQGAQARHRDHRRADAALSRPCSMPSRACHACRRAAAPSPKASPSARRACITQAIIEQHVDDMLLVDEGDIEQAIVMLLEIEKTLVEGAGAAGLAALLRHPERFRGRKVGLVLGGRKHRPVAAGGHHRTRHGARRPAGARAGAVRAMCRARWRGSRPSSAKRALTSTRFTTSAPSPCWRRRTWRSSW